MNWKAKAKAQHKLLRPGGVERLLIGKGKADIEFNGFGVKVIAASVAQYFRESGGINYVSVEVKPAKGPWLDVLIQRRGGSTPAKMCAQYKSLCLKLARHIRNTDEKHPAPWSFEAIELLGEVRAMDAATYDAEVK